MSQMNTLTNQPPLKIYHKTNIGLTIRNNESSKSTTTKLIIILDESNKNIIYQTNHI